MGDNGAPFLCDFGRSKFIARRGYTTEFTGTYRYLAPELLNSAMDSPGEEEPSEPSEPSTTKETDVYAFALIGVEVSKFLLLAYYSFLSFFRPSSSYRGVHSLFSSSFP
jgi:serine/threonine protein kinase